MWQKPMCECVSASTCSMCVYVCVNREARRCSGKVAVGRSRCKWIWGLRGTEMEASSSWKALWLRRSEGQCSRLHLPAQRRRVWDEPETLSSETQTGVRVSIRPHFMLSAGSWHEIEDTQHWRGLIFHTGTHITWGCWCLIFRKGKISRGISDKSIEYMIKWLIHFVPE